MRSLKNKYLTGIQKIFADGGYLGELIEWVLIQFGWTLEIVKRNETGTWTDILMKQGAKWVIIGDHGGATEEKAQ